MRLFKVGAFFISNTFISNARLRLNFCYLKINHILQHQHLRNAYATTFVAQFMRKLINTEVELKKSITYKNSV